MASSSPKNNFMTGKEDLVPCPYNGAHIILKSRLYTHLIKCRQQHNIKKFRTCPFNATHDVPAPEIQYHIENCPDRKHLENYLYVVDDPKPDEEKSYQIEVPSFSENWDEEGSSSTSYLNVRDKEVEKHVVFRQLSGKSKAEKKAFAFDEVLRLDKVCVKKKVKHTSK